MQQFSINSNHETTYCYVTCTAMVYTGQADSLVHSRVKKIEVGGRRVGELLSFPLDHLTRLILAHYLTVYLTKVYNGRVIRAFSYSRLYSTTYSTNVN
jgi:hypothetical protein